MIEENKKRGLNKLLFQKKIIKLLKYLIAFRKIKNIKLINLDHKLS
jgi:hypothetical protein